MADRLVVEPSVLGEALFTRETSRPMAELDWMTMHPLGRQSYINRASGTLAKPVIEEDGPAELSLSDAQIWALRHAVVYWRLAEPSQIPRGAAIVRNAAIKAGWDVRAGYMRGVWVTARGPKLVDPTALTATDDDEDDDGASGKYFPGIYDAITVQGRKDGRRFRAWWYRKFWTKDGAAGKYAYVGAQLRPSVTQGGLHNSNTLSSYIKREDPQ